MSLVENTRKIPRQSRSKISVDVVLEAAAQILEASGEAGFNTNAVAIPSSWQRVSRRRRRGSPTPKVAP
ncbi:hypothetical protein [Caulobacter sp.]|uniref:hypothetical protein n=1 Tax=Caulobacter sp. TaxID=78 RepID=UPI0025BA06B4|nr:hypothetical protein [Caulobacter sp.]